MLNRRKTKAELIEELDLLRRKAVLLEDVQARHLRVESELRQSEERLRATLDLACDFAYAYRVLSDGSISLEWLTESFHELTGYTAHEFNDRYWTSLVHPDDRRQVECWLRSLLTGGSAAVEYRITAKDGRTLWLRDTARSEWDASESRVARVLGAVNVADERPPHTFGITSMETYFRQILNELPEAVFIKDKDLRFVFVNRMCAQMMRLPDSAIIGKTVYDFCSPTQASLFDARDRLVLDTGQPHAQEEQYTDHDGNTHILLTSVAPYTDSSDGLALVGVCRDVTDERNVGEALWKAKKEYEQTFDAVPDLIALIDLNYKITRVNKAMADRLGRTPKECLGLTCFKAVHGTDAPPVYCPHHSTVLDGQMHTAEIQEPRLGGDFVVTTSAMHNGKGNIIGVAHTAHDITQRRQMEHSLRQSEAAEREFRQKLTLLHRITNALSQLESEDDLCREAVVMGCTQLGFDRIGIWFTNNEPGVLMGSWGVDESGQLRNEHHMRVSVSLPHFTDIISGKKHVCSLRNYLVTDFNGHDLGKADCALAGLWDGRRIVGVVCTDMILSRKPMDASHIELLTLYASAIGHLYTRICLERDRRTLELQVLHTQKLESLGILASGIAHDFNNLLAAIQGNAELTLEDLREDSPSRSCVEAIDVITRRAAELCQQMLAYSGHTSVEQKHISLPDLVREMAHLLEVSISKKTSLQLSLSENTPDIMADSAQIRQIIMNLITNASEAIGDIGGTITATVAPMMCNAGFLRACLVNDNCPPGLYTCLEVSDTGCGMDTQTIMRIFDPFFSTKVTGRGLGLAAVLGIVRSHRGAIHVESSPGQGSLFRVLLPAMSEDTPQETQEAEFTAPWQGKANVLLVDDDDAVRQVTQSILERAGLTVYAVSDGRKALDLFSTMPDQINCVILDLAMPVMNGEETLEALLQVRPDVKIIMMSGYAEKQIAAKLESKGAFAVIQKPFRRLTLLGKLRMILDKPKPAG